MNDPKEFNGFSILDNLKDRLTKINESEFYHPEQPINLRGGEKEVGIVPVLLRALWTLAQLLISESQIVIAKAAATGRKDVIVKAQVESMRLMNESKLLTELFWYELRCHFAGQSGDAFTGDMGFRENWKAVVMPARGANALMNMLGGMMGAGLPGMPQLPGLMGQGQMPADPFAGYENDLMDEEGMDDESDLDDEQDFTPCGDPNCFECGKRTPAVAAEENLDSSTPPSTPSVTDEIQAPVQPEPEPVASVG